MFSLKSTFHQMSEALFYVRTCFVYLTKQNGFRKRIHAELSSWKKAGNELMLNVPRALRHKTLIVTSTFTSLFFMERTSCAFRSCEEKSFVDKLEGDISGAFGDDIFLVLCVSCTPY